MSDNVMLRALEDADIPAAGLHAEITVNVSHGDIAAPGLNKDRVSNIICLDISASAFGFDARCEMSCLNVSRLGGRFDEFNFMGRIDRQLGRGPAAPARVIAFA